MYAIDVKKLIEKRTETVLTVSGGPVSATATFRQNDGDMELSLFGDKFVIVFDKVEISDSYGVELWFKGMCVASIDVTGWREL